jgi:hypothetical protein
VWRYRRRRRGAAPLFDGSDSQNPVIWQRRLGYGLVGVLLAAHGVFSLWPALTTIGNDFANYYVPARLVLAGAPVDSLYERNWLQNEIRRAGIDRLGSFAPNPPANALLMLPVAGLPPAPAKAVWSGILGLALLASFLLLRRLAPGTPSWLLALAFLLQSASLANALRYGPPYALLLLLLCASLWALGEGRPLLAGALLAPVLALKLYGLPFALAFALARRWRALGGLLAGLALTAAASVALLGWPVHDVYRREVLPPSLAGELLDPYATSLQNVASVAHRLFQREPELNPAPVVDNPALARAATRGLSVALVLLGALAWRREGGPRRARREWAALMFASLAASTFTGTYHFLLLALPIGLLVADAHEHGEPGRVMLLLALLAFATSTLPLWLGRFAHGWGNLVAAPRLAVLLALVGVSLRALLSCRRLAAGIGGGAIAGALAYAAPQDPPWHRVESARGYALGEPVACGGALAWVAVEGEHLVVRDSEGRVFGTQADAFSPRCDAGRLRFEASSRPGSSDDPVSGADADHSPDGRLIVAADRAAGGIVEHRAGQATRILAPGRLRRPRLSPDGRWVACQAWQAATRSWDVVAIERDSGRVVRVTSDPANQVEPSWLPTGEGLVFASDHRRGLGFPAVYSVGFSP